jgi:hypothetical protein
MTWRAISAERACSMIDFWIAAPWPISGEQVRALAPDLGWTVDADGTPRNIQDGLSQPAVITGEAKGMFASLSFWVTDVVKGDDPAGTDFLDDQFALLVREGSSRWGKAKLTRGRSKNARWELTGGGRVDASRLKSSVTLEFITPQYADVLRDLGE